MTIVQIADEKYGKTLMETLDAIITVPASGKWNVLQARIDIGSNGEYLAWMKSCTRNAVSPNGFVGSSPTLSAKAVNFC